MVQHLTKGILAIACGLMIPLALAPFNYWPLMLAGIAGFFWLSQVAARGWQAAYLGWLFGVGYFGLGVSWIFGSMQTVDTPLWLALILTGGFCLLMALFHAFQLWFFVKFLRALPFALSLAAPLWWLVNEWIREWFLTGMPWLYAGYGFITLATGQLAALVGIYGLSLLMALLAALLSKAVASGCQQQWRTSLICMSALLLLFTLTHSLGRLLPASHWTIAEGTLTAAAVQSNVDQRVKWSSAQQRPTLDFYGSSITAMPDIDLVLWPEAAMTRRAEQIPTFIRQLDALGKRRDQAIMTGILTRHDGRYYNALVGYGSAAGEYQKQHLVPFGEYVPLESVLRGLIDFFDLPMSTMHPAAEPQQPIGFSLNGRPYRAAPVICYEAAYPEIVRLLAKESELITVVSNDAWFGDSIGPHQHLQITQMRAIENGRAIVRATQNGISALINADGKIIAQAEQFIPAEIIGEVRLRSGKTPFQHISASLPVYLAIVLLLLMGLFSLRLTKSAAAKTN